MAIIECLKAGDLKINADLKQLEIAEGQLIYPFDKIKDYEWGYVYEKFVGQVLESEGFKVTYNGFNGFVDGGVDLIAEKGNSVTFIQCKFSQKKKLGKSHIEHILNKASNKLLKAFNDRSKQLVFALVVHSKEKNFRRRPLKDDPHKREYPWLHHFLSQDKKHNGLRIGFREITMQV